MSVPPAPKATTSMAHAPLVLADEVADALASARPVVALESTIIAHGLPRPRNLEVARALGAQLRAAGVTPATIAVIDGVPRIGLDEAALHRVAEDDEVSKASTRDLPVVMAQGASAATTVASTALLARRAGIDVFATGGLGGVHRDAASTFDESADLTVLARTDLVVVAAGVKSILDVPATLERLETYGVTVVGYRTDRFPGFYVTDSGEPVWQRIEEPRQAAAILQAARTLALPGAVLVANPVAEHAQLDPAVHEQVLADSLAQARARGIRGKDVTPFLLDHIQRQTDGESLETNIAVVEGNVALAGEIATALADVG
ncbi:MAG: pseudouridine-5'-phosphate glycosidase [Nitriliruptoraceae bacterium]|nr:pseudouridine-5'-phosphate glycosidase [Nitriliruptoraceae bacterium]